MSHLTGKTEYRRTWRGKMILMVQFWGPGHRSHLFTRRWRDATWEDALHLQAGNVSDLPPKTGFPSIDLDRATAEATEQVREIEEARDAAQRAADSVAVSRSALKTALRGDAYVYESTDHGQMHCANCGADDSIANYGDDLFQHKPSCKHFAYMAAITCLGAAVYPPDSEERSV